jgi:hypothetical protein
MSKPTTTADFGPDAQTQLADAVEAGVIAAGLGLPTTPWQTGQVAIAAAPSITQLPAQPTPSGVLLRADADVFVNSISSATGGMTLYEGDDLKFANITNLDQVYVLPVKNQATVIRWATL